VFVLIVVKLNDLGLERVYVTPLTICYKFNTLFKNYTNCYVSDRKWGDVG